MTQDPLTQVVTTLEMAHRVLQGLNDRVDGIVGLTLNQVLVLSEIDSGNGRATVSSLAETLGRAVHTLTSAVNGLERKGLVNRRSIRGEDRRIIRIGVTNTGSEAMATFRKSASSVAGAMRDDPFAASPPSEVTQSVRAMVRLFES